MATTMEAAMYIMFNMHVCVCTHACTCMHLDACVHIHGGTPPIPTPS